MFVYIYIYTYIYLLKTYQELDTSLVVGVFTMTKKDMDPIFFRDLAGKWEGQAKGKNRQAQVRQ